MVNPGSVAVVIAILDDQPASLNSTEATAANARVSALASGKPGTMPLLLLLGVADVRRQSVGVHF